MALPDFPDYHKWGFSLAVLNNTVYVTGGFPAAPSGELITVTPPRTSCPLRLRQDSSRHFRDMKTRTFKIHGSTRGRRGPFRVLTWKAGVDSLGSLSQGPPEGAV